MKANLRGLGGIKHFFIAHGEKLGIFVVALCTIAMLYNAMGRQGLPLNRQAGELKKQISEAETSMASFTWEKMKADFPTDIREWKPLQQKGASTVDTKAYEGKYANIP